MTTPIQDLQQTIDDARGIATDIGARIYTVTRRLRTWSGGELDAGTPTDVDIVLAPRPKVRAQSRGIEAALQEALTSGGQRVQGDLVVEQVSMAYALADLEPTLSAGQELLYIVAGVDGGQIAATTYVLSKPPFRKLTQWVLYLRKSERT
jgi:hypothetical protein